MERQHKLANRPALFLDLDLSNPPLMDLILRNVGVSKAINPRVVFEPAITDLANRPFNVGGGLAPL